MAFDLSRFRETKYQPRTGTVKVPALGGLFSEGSEPVFTVRGVTGQELGLIKEAEGKRRDALQIAGRLMSAGGGEQKAEAVLEALGFNDKLAPDTATRLELLMVAAVDPKLERKDAIKLCRTFPIEFYSVTTKILELTGQGQDPGESSGSGETPPSEPR
ncbi:MAG: hypothetical protein ACOWWM_09705 [Desulfobacterales bacterium]